MLCLGGLEYPTKVRDSLYIYLSATNSQTDVSSESYGRWLVGEPLYNLDETWQRIVEQMMSKTLSATGLKCTTGRYNPSSAGPGPTKNGAISVYTTKENRDIVGDQLIQIVQHDIVYKSNEASGKYRHRGDRHLLEKTLYWNKGEPSSQNKLKWKRKNKVHTAEWNERLRDDWHLNIAVCKEKKLTRKEISGYWQVGCSYENLTVLWHIIKDKIESGSIGPVKMVCPKPDPRRKKKDSIPLFLVFTAEENYSLVGTFLKDNESLIISFSFIQTSKCEQNIAQKDTPKLEQKVPSLEYS